MGPRQASLARQIEGCDKGRNDDLISDSHSQGPSLTIILQDSNSGEIFAQCPILNVKEMSIAIEPVIDSSRYFVIRVMNEAGDFHVKIGSHPPRSARVSWIGIWGAK